MLLCEWKWGRRMNGKCGGALDRGGVVWEMVHMWYEEALVLQKSIL